MFSPHPSCVLPRSPFQADLALVSAAGADGGNTPPGHRKGRLQLGSSVGLWHSMTLSCSQQLFGPLRLCADLRLALDCPRSPIPRGVQPMVATLDATDENGDSRLEGTGSTSIHSSGWRRLTGAAAAVATVRPALLDATYGLDLAVPGAAGLARVVAWYSPGRKEGMVELRVF